MIRFWLLNYAGFILGFLVASALVIDLDHTSRLLIFGLSPLAGLIVAALAQAWWAAR